MLSAWIAVFDGRPAWIGRDWCNIAHVPNIAPVTAHPHGPRTKDAAPVPRPTNLETTLLQLEHALQRNCYAHISRVENAYALYEDRRRNDARYERGTRRERSWRTLPPRTSPPALYRSGKWFPSFPNVLPIEKFNPERRTMNWLSRLVKVVILDIARWRVTELFAQFNLLKVEMCNCHGHCNDEKHNLLLFVFIHELNIPVYNISPWLFGTQVTEISITVLAVN